MDREVKGAYVSTVVPIEKHRNSGIYTKDGKNPRSNESERRKRQALADRKDTNIRRQCMEKIKIK